MKEAEHSLIGEEFIYQLKARDFAFQSFSKKSSLDDRTRIDCSLEDFGANAIEKSWNGWENRGS